MLLVTGGSGNLGRKLVPKLLDRGLPVRVLTRDPGRASHLAGAGVEVVQGDLRDAASVRRAVEGVRTIVSAAHGFGVRGQSPAQVDEQGNMTLVAAAAAEGSAVVLLSIVGANEYSPIGLFRSKFVAEEYLKDSGVPWTIVRSTAFIETWARIIGAGLSTGGRTLVLGRGRNPINFVSTEDVAALVARAVVDESLRGEVLEIGGEANISMLEFAQALQKAAGRPGKPKRVPRPLLRALSVLARPFNASFARQARAGVVLDTADMTFDASATRARFPDLPHTPFAEALESSLARR